MKAGLGSDSGVGNIQAATQTVVATEQPTAIAADSLPHRFAHYELAIEETGGHLPIELGRGAMGVTYLARDVVLDFPVALKVISARLSATYPQARARFLREAKAAARLHHPNVASVFHYGEQEGQCFYAMELVEGETLESRVRRDGPFAVGPALEITRQVTNALVAAEARGIVHRDLKPANLMLGLGSGGKEDAAGDGLMVKVIDFGLAKAVAAAALGSAEAADLTHSGFVGTPAYASPEQFAAGGECIDIRSDLYSLGVTLWFLLTGKVPFIGRSLSEIYDRQVNRALPLQHLREANVPAAVVTLLQRMLAADPAERPQTARELEGQLRHCREQLGLARAAIGDGKDTNPRRRWRLPATLGALILLVAAVVIVAVLTLNRGRRLLEAGPLPLTTSASTATPEKSVAVLPFENLSEDKANAFFADGVQEEVLSDLAKVADLKVISRTSVMQYRDAAKRGNLREIAAALGVSHIVEGSVQRAGNQVRVSAELIDARTDAHRWSEHYDRSLDNAFAIQSEIAQAIAGSLRARLSPSEKANIAARPTTDVMAYDLYLQARELVAGFQETSDWRETLLRAVRLLDDATRRDGNFALAWCLVAQAHDQLYFTGFDASSQRLLLQERAVETALRLQPELGEAHLARARLLYRGRKDYEGARRELAIARAALPNSAEVFALTSYIDRRLGRWQEALTSQEKAFSLDPRNPATLNDQTLLYDILRMYPEEIRVADEAIKALPDSKSYYELIKAAALLSAGQTAAARARLNLLPASYDPNGATTYTRICAALYDNRMEEAAQVLAEFRGPDYPGFNSVMLPRAWLEALVARAAGNEGNARATMLRLRESAEQAVQQQPDDPFALAFLGQVDAGLGRKEAALREGRHAVEMRPVSVDATDGPSLETALALICTWTGEADEAMQHLLILAKTPGGPDFGQLRYDPAWASLHMRKDYQTMLAQLNPHLIP